MAAHEGRLRFGLVLVLVAGTPPGVQPRRAPRALGAGWDEPPRKCAEEPPPYLRWVGFEGRPPPDAVSSWNSRLARAEFVCSTLERGCNTGAYVPERGPFCFYPYGGRERQTPHFQLLLNVGGFEALFWADGSFGSVPEGAVDGCPCVDIFVGRNRYGLGKVSKEQRALFVAEEGEEVWYKWYQVLAVRRGPAAVTISNVAYNLSGLVERGEDVVLAEAMLRNEGCGAAREAAALAAHAEVEHDWRAEQDAFAAARGTLRAGLLRFDGTRWGVANATSVPWAGAASAGEFVAYTRVVEELLGPRTACAVAMEGRRRDVRVPFAARLTRDFGGGRVHRVAGTGWAHTRAVVGVRAGVKECWPLTDLPPCPP